jgi:PAS domain-containing protein
MRASTPISLEYRVVLPDGSVKHMRSEGRRGGGDDYIGTTMDVTAARNVEAQRRRSEAYLTEGQRLTRTGSWGWNLATGEIFWSREMFRIYGFDATEGTPPYEAVLARAHPEDAPGVDAGLTASFETGAELRLLTRILVPGSGRSGCRRTVTPCGTRAVASRSSSARSSTSRTGCAPTGACAAR